jgi:ATP-dependent exoDNAse (exonuclease V) beta subunit
MTGAVTAPTADREWTPAQLTAIRSRERTLVAAAAGSGKTSVLTELVAQALVAREIAPADVCAVTFTEKAAQEMRGRIAARLVELDERDLVAELELARIGTIHSLCSTILRRHGAAVGVDPGVGQLDEAQEAWIKREALVSAVDHLTSDPDVHWLRARMGDDRIEQLLRGVHRCAAQGDGTVTFEDPDAVTAILDPKDASTLVSVADQRRALVAVELLWERFDAEVEARKRTLGRISFDDLERLAVEAVRVPQVRTDLRARWSMLLVDEFQDTNERQYELLDAIGGDRLFMVGDEWQSIYRFRGADVNVFRARRTDASGGIVVPMRENFRSVAPVLDVVNRVFAAEHLFGERYEDVRPGTAAQRDVEAPAVELLVVPDEEVGEELDLGATTGRQREALRVAERIATLVDSGEAEPGDIAVLYARRTGVDLYEQALRAWGLPVLREASGDYYDQRDVRDALALLSLVRNPGDDFAALGVLAGPIGRLEWSALGELVRDARTASQTLLEAACSSSHAGANRVRELLAQLDAVAASEPLVRLVASVTALPELEVGAALEADGVVRVANLRRLVALAASAEQIGVRSVAGFLEFVAAQRRDARVGEASIADEGVGAVRMLTVHASKGLEFPHVFVIEAAAAGGSPPELVPSPMLDDDGTLRIAMPKRDGRCVNTAVLEQLRDHDADAEREESLRLWYVAMTRARSKLYISGRWDFTPTKAGKPRSLGGALAWLRDALELEPDLGGPHQVSLVLDGLVQLDTNVTRQAPRDVWRGHEELVALAAPIPLPPIAPAPAATPSPEPDPHALRSALRDAVGSARSDEWRQLDGTRVHDAVARVLDAARAGVALDQLLDPDEGPWLTDSVRARLEPVVASAAFRRLVEFDGRSEVPYVAGSGVTVESRVAPGVDVVANVADIDAGRIDALAILPDGRWWVVDWKTTLPDDADAAWHEHGDQLRRYARAAIATGAPGALVTLVPLDRPDDAVTWSLDPASSVWSAPTPQRAGIPAAP